MLISKTLSLRDCQLKMVGDSGRFEGWASIFDVKDLQGDIVKAGAFKSTLRDHGLPKMFYDHRWDMPIGKYVDAEERQAKGLWVVGELTSGHSRATDVAAALKHETLDGLSVGGHVRKGDWVQLGDDRHINVWTKLVEISPTCFPANTEARIASVKSADPADLADSIAEIDSIRDLERFLRDAGGLTKGAAVALVARVKSVLGVEGEPDTKSIEAKQLQELHERISGMATAIRA
jgi:uncharacterized protein